MNINATVPFCQFSTQRPVVFQWVIEYAKACRMQLEYLVLSQIISEVQYLDSNSSTWCNSGQCCLSIQAIADTWGMSPATVRSAINTLELAGIITVEVRAGAANRVTLTPHTEWVVSNFRELRAPNKKQRQRVSPTPATPSHWVVNTTNTTDTPATPSADTTPNTPATPSPWVEGTRYPYRVLTNTPDTDTTNTPATPSADTPPATVVVNTTDTICTNVADTPATPPNTTDTPATVTGGNGKKQLPILKPKVSPTPATPSPYTPPPEHISLQFNNNKNGKKLRVSPTPDTPATNITDTPPTPTPATNTTDTPATPI